MNWQVRTVLAGVLAALGLYIMFNPVRVTTLVAGTIPWLLLAGGGIYLLAVVLPWLAHHREENAVEQPAQAEAA